MIGLALFVYRRAVYLKKVLEGIKKNRFEKIYIFQDGYTEGIALSEWEEVSDIIRGVDFTDVEVCISDAHKGLAQSILEGMDYVFEHHDFAIALEDDIVPLEGYRKFIEECLEKYDANDEVMCVCGASIGTLIPDDYGYDAFFCDRMCSAAFGTWKSNWIEFKRDYALNPFTLRSIYTDDKKKKRLISAGEDITELVLSSLKGEADTWATYWGLYQVDKLGLQVIPCKALAEDIGRNGDGTNTKNKMIRFEGELLGCVPEHFRLPDQPFIDKRIAFDNHILACMVNDHDRFAFYYPFFANWIKVLQKGKSIKLYFERHSIEAIYVYGIGKAAKCLSDELQDMVSIKNYIVEIPNVSEFTGVSVIGIMDADLDDNIPIVVTPVHDKGYLLHLFERFCITNRIIWINDIIDYCLGLIDSD